MSIGRVADALPIPTGTAAEREMRGFLRAIVRKGFGTTDSYEDPCCFYCRVPDHGPSTRHSRICLYVRAKELLAKYPANHG